MELAGLDLKRVKERGVVLVANDDEEEFHEVDSLIVSRGYRPRKKLKQDIAATNLGCEVCEVGDCAEVRNYFYAINEGAHTAREKIG